MSFHIDWKLLTKVPDLVQREALVYQLGQAQIEVYAPDRDVMTVLGSGPQLGWEGYSAVFDGYSVFVSVKDWTRAQEILKSFQGTPNSDTASFTDSMDRFHLCAIFTFLLPIILHLAALYHLFWAVKKDQFQWSLRTLFSVLIFLATLSLLIVFLGR